MAIANYDYSKQIANLKNAQQKAATADLQATRNQALSNLNAEQQQNAANYATQRSTANAQNRLNARNFQEYLANTGRANSGLGAQAAMQYNNNLNTSLNNIYGAENAANADILRRRTDAQNAYSTGLAKANADIQANYIQSLIDARNARFDRDMKLASQKLAEKEFKESIRQFNKNYDLQKRNFSSGSGGGSSRGGAYSGYSGYGVDPFGDSQSKGTTTHDVYDMIKEYGNNNNSLLGQYAKLGTSLINKSKIKNQPVKATKPKTNKTANKPKKPKNEPTKLKINVSQKQPALLSAKKK